MLQNMKKETVSLKWYLIAWKYSYINHFDIHEKYNCMTDDFYTIIIFIYTQKRTVYQKTIILKQIVPQTNMAEINILNEDFVARSRYLRQG